MYTFTRDQLARLLERTIDLYDELQRVHGQDAQLASMGAINKALVGLDAERELWRQGEIKTPGQVLLNDV
jgi:hypothetical protein